MPFQRAATRLSRLGIYLALLLLTIGPNAHQEELLFLDLSLDAGSHRLLPIVMREGLLIGRGCQLDLRKLSLQVGVLRYGRWSKEKEGSEGCRQRKLGFWNCLSHATSCLFIDFLYLSTVTISGADAAAQLRDCIMLLANKS